MSAILAVFGLGLPAFVLIKAFTPGYFAREDTRTPMIFAAVSVAVNISTALWLFPTLGAPGIATAAAVAGWVNASMLLGVLIARGHWASDAGLVKRIPRLVVASGLMAGAILLATSWLGPQFDPASPIYIQAAALAAIVLGAMAIYFATAFGLGGADIGMIRRNVRRKSGAQGVTEPSPDP